VPWLVVRLRVEGRIFMPRLFRPSTFLPGKKLVAALTTTCLVTLTSKCITIPYISSVPLFRHYSAVRITFVWPPFLIIMCFCCWSFRTAIPLPKSTLTKSIFLRFHLNISTCLCTGTVICISFVDSIGFNRRLLDRSRPNTQKSIKLVVTMYRS